MAQAARLGDNHVCPAFVIPVVKPHVGGPISSGAPTVLIGGPAAARVSDWRSARDRPTRSLSGARRC